MSKPKTPAQKTMDARVLKKGAVTLLCILVAALTLLPDNGMPSSPVLLTVQVVAVTLFVYHIARFMRLMTLRARAYDPKGH